MSTTTKRILNPKAKPEEQVVLQKIVLLYSVPGTLEEHGLHHQWIELDSKKIVPGQLETMDITFDMFTVHKVHG